MKISRLKDVLCLKDMSAGVLRKVLDDTDAFMLGQVLKCLWHKLGSL